MRRGWRRGLAGCLAATLVTSLAVALVAQAPESRDAARSAWQYRRTVMRPSDDAAGRFLSIAVPPDVAERSQRGLQDLRLVGDDGREVPFVLDVDVPRTTERRRTGRLVEALQDRRRQSAWIVDFGSSAPFDRLELDIDGADFSKRVTLETSDDGRRWTPVEGDTWVFDRPWRGRQVHDTAIERPAPLVARFVRVTLDDWRSPPVVVRSATAILTGHLGGGRWTRDATLTRLDAPAGAPSRYRVEAPTGLPVERVTIATTDAAFWREVRVIEEAVGRAGEAISAPTPVYRLRLGDDDLDVERRDVDLLRAAVGSLILEIQDGDSPALAQPRATLSGMTRRMLVPPVETGLTLYYGNPVTRRPVYDLEALRSRLSLAATYPQASLGPEAGNPRFTPVPPMAFLAARGAEADSTLWAFARAVTITGSDDVYTLTLDPADLAHLRADLADVRIVDAERRQVPYVLEAQAEAARVPLEVVATAARGQAKQTSAFQLRVPGSGDVTTRPALPLSQIELVFAEAFFTRPAVVLLADTRAPLGQRVIGELTLTAARREAGLPPAPQVLSLGELRVQAIGVEMKDGDNAPLKAPTAAAVVWVPRLTFKATAGTYRVLLGNPEAGLPTYDLAALRHDVLAYSALPIDDGAIQPLTPNADYARRAGDVVQGLARGPLLWGALGVSMVALLWLTRKILKSPPAPPPHA